MSCIALKAFNDINKARKTHEAASQYRSPNPPEIKKIATPEEVLREVNKLRAEVGVKPLALDDRLNESAKLKVRDMIDNGYYAHQNPTTGKHGYEYAREAVGNDCISVGENLNKTNETFDARGVVNSWSESKPHYAAMINPHYHSMGFYIDTSGWPIMAQHFCAK